MHINNYFEGIKTGDNIRVILRNVCEIKSSPTVGFSVMLSNNEQSSLGIITDAKRDDNVLDLTVASCYKDGHRVNDGQMNLKVLLTNWGKAQRLL